MKTHHQVCFQNSIEMAQLPSNSVDLVVTSPPYPMIEMWDDGFSRLNPSIQQTNEIFWDSDETFAYIAGYTSAGFPYGITWEELGEEPSDFED